jgi:hypothetical protein
MLEIENLKSIRYPQSEIRNPQSAICNLQSEIRNLQSMRCVYENPCN